MYSTRNAYLFAVIPTFTICVAMPSAEIKILNRAASCFFIPTDTLSAINARYVRRVDETEGISLTGFIATVTLPTAQKHVDNAIEVYLFEDFPFDPDQDIAGVIFEPHLLFKYDFNAPFMQNLLSERFFSPYQLRYGHTYMLLARFLGNVAPAPPINIRLTALGYENAQDSPAKVQLR